MSLVAIQQIIQQGIWQVFKICAPVLGAALIVGLIVAILQATTSIQEQTLTFLPKLLIILLLIALLSGWMFSSTGQYFTSIMELIPQMAR